MTEVFKGAKVIDAILEDVNDFFVSDVNNSCALVEEALHVLADRLALLLLELHQVHVSTRVPHGTCEVPGELHLRLSPLVDVVLVKRLEPSKRRLIQIERKVEALVWPGSPYVVAIVWAPPFVAEVAVHVASCA